jgi:sn-glycerol 3-phosphate transport system permease protein
MRLANGESLVSEQGTARATARTVASSARARARRETAVSLLYLVPSLVVFGVFIFYPLFKSIYLSLFASDPFGLGSTPFVGLKQYQIALRSQSYRDGLGVTLLYTLYTVPLGILIALGLAVLANLRVRGIGFFRTVYALPIGVSVGATSIVFLLLYNSRAGVLNYFLTSLGLPAIEWLTEPRAALWAVAILSIWAGIGFNFIVLLSGLQGIPEELYESARIDGATNLRIFRSVTLPMLMPTLFFVLIVSTISAFQSFAQIHILTQGGPANATSVVVYSIYREAFFNFQTGYASAQAVILFVIILILTAIQFLVVERRVHYA